MPNFETLPVPYTREEREDLYEGLLKSMDKIDREDRSFDLKKDEHKTEIKALEQVRDEIREKLSKGTRDQMVECIWDYDWVRGLKYYVRTDTGEIIRTKEVTEKDRQLCLEMKEKEQTLAEKNQEVIDRMQSDLEACGGEYCPGTDLDIAA